MPQVGWPEKFKQWRWPLLVGLAGWLAVLATRDHPGITSDEPFNVQYGKDFVSKWRAHGAEFFTPNVVSETFSTRHEHPPLGRWAIGWVHRLQNWTARAEDFSIQDILDARAAPATAFALMLVLLTRVVASRHGTAAGVTAGLCLLLMPRSFGHAHFAALDTFMSFTYMTGILSAAWMMESRRPWLSAPLAGVLLGLAFLTKIHAVFLLPIVGIWVLVFYRIRGIPALALWFLSGLEIFYAGWPWLWDDLDAFWSSIRQGIFSQPGWFLRLPQVFSRFTSFLGTSVERDAIFVTYLGRDYRDIFVPWHYPWVLFAVTVPVGIHVLGVLGVWQTFRSACREPRNWLYLAALAFPMLVFSVPRVPVYDGVRMFLMVFPFWAAFAGRGAGFLYEWLSSRWQPRWATVALAGCLGCQAIGVCYYQPFQLSYYNLLVGGLRGANRLGFEVTYWGDSVNQDLLDRWSSLAPRNACAVLVPNLYVGQSDLYGSPGIREKNQRISGAPNSSCQYLLVYNRRAYFGDTRQFIDDPGQRVLVENVVDGVWISRVYVQKPPQTAGSNESLSDLNER